MIKEFYKDNYFVDLAEKISKLKELVKKYKVADCGEHMPCLIFNLAENGIASEAFHVNILPKIPGFGPKRYYTDHSFPLVGRQKNSGIQQYWDWGKDALICDGWHGKVYTVEEGINQYMQDFKFSPNTDKLVFSKDYYQETENELNEIIRKANKNINL